ncbi:hypothetical protein JTB14_023646 [Gonioctena quinquepunctata]|nr:hypothetical protein JTB14_023646 [Gonioctena quinquepunctata]
MWKITSLFLLLSVNGYPQIFQSRVVTSDNCQENEQFIHCTSACMEIPTCQNRFPRNPGGLGCTAVCVPRCLCKSGFLKDENLHKCVPIAKCPKS